MLRPLKFKIKNMGDLKIFFSIIVYESFFKIIVFFKLPDFY